MKKKINGRIIEIYCANCKNLVYKYLKSGPGHLVKCYKDRILGDYTNKDLKCKKCGKLFARDAIICGKPAHKIIQGKVFVKK